MPPQVLADRPETGEKRAIEPGAPRGRAVDPPPCPHRAVGGAALKAYLINLDRSEDRLAHMRAALGRAGVAFERVAAVDGKALGEEALEDFRRARKAAKPEGWLPGEIGCFLSHLEAWRRIAAGPEPHAAVFEDDLHVAADLGRLLDAPGWIPPDADVVRLEANRPMRLACGRPIAAAPGRALYRALSGSPGSAAYVLARRAAAWLAESEPALHTGVDVCLFKPKASAVARRLRRYQVVPAPCVQDGVTGEDVRLASEIKGRATRGRGYRERISPLLGLWPLQRRAVPFRE